MPRFVWLSVMLKFFRRSSRRMRSVDRNWPFSESETAAMSSQGTEAMQSM